MNSAKAGPPPNPAATAKAQTETTKEAAIAQQTANAPDQIGVAGYLTSKVDPKTGKVTATTGLSPGEQGIYDTGVGGRTMASGTALAQLGSAAPMLSKSIDLSDPNIGSEITSKLAPQFQAERERQRLAMDTTLANKGIFQGSEAYKNATRDFDANQNDAWNRFSVDARGRIVNEMLTGRNQPIQEFGALQGLSPVTWPNQNFTNTPTVNMQPTDVAGITQQGYENRLVAAQMQNQQSNAMMSGLFGLGSAALMAGTGGLGGLALPALSGLASGGLMAARSQSGIPLSQMG